MPIGKNALKRVNNGYSNVKTTAPDMEHSEIWEPEVKKTEKKPAEKKSTAKSTSKTAPKSAPKKAEKKADNKSDKLVKDSHPDGFVRFAFGEDLPVYLL